MNVFMDLSWRGYPAVALIVLGLWMASVGVRRDAADVRRPASDPRKAWAMVRCFRTVVVGLAAAAAGVGWLFGLEPLLGIALIIGVGETIETTTVLAACRDGGVGVARAPRRVATPQRAGEVRRRDADDSPRLSRRHGS
jgi:uncharacterized membrane protein YfcA